MDKVMLLSPSGALNICDDVRIKFFPNRLFETIPYKHTFPDGARRTKKGGDFDDWPQENQL